MWTVNHIYVKSSQSCGGSIKCNNGNANLCSLPSVKIFIKDFYQATFLVSIWLLFNVAPLSGGWAHTQAQCVFTVSLSLSLSLSVSLCLCVSLSHTHTHYHSIMSCMVRLWVSQEWPWIAPDNITAAWHLFYMWMHMTVRWVINICRK